MNAPVQNPLVEHEHSQAIKFLKMSEQHAELLRSIVVMPPVRPAEGIPLRLYHSLALWHGIGMRVKDKVDYMGGFIEVTRASMALDFLNMYPDAKYLLMIDSDMEPDALVPYMLARHDKPVVGACCMSYSKYGPQLCFSVPSSDGKMRFPTMNSGKPIPERGLKEVGHVGTGCILIRRDVLESFTFEAGDVPFYVREDIRVQGAKTGTIGRGEDIEFCYQVKEKGFDIFVDLEVHVGHRKSIAMKWSDGNRDPTMDAQTWVVPPDGMPFGD